jgi:pyruvate/2-oxoacid:ferredoxin oxidoreductase beta subunit
MKVDGISDLYYVEQIATGEYDGVIENLCKALEAYGGPV